MSLWYQIYIQVGLNQHTAPHNRGEGIVHLRQDFEQAGFSDLRAGGAGHRAVFSNLWPVAANSKVLCDPIAVLARDLLEGKVLIVLACRSAETARDRAVLLDLGTVAAHRGPLASPGAVLAGFTPEQVVVVVLAQNSRGRSRWDCTGSTSERAGFQDRGQGAAGSKLLSPGAVPASFIPEQKVGVVLAGTVATSGKAGLRCTR